MKWKRRTTDSNLYFFFFFRKLRRITWSYTESHECVKQKRGIKSKELVANRIVTL